MFGRVCLFLRPLKYILRPLTFLLHHSECFLGNGSDKPLKCPPIFIIGAPRSGSTLLYQVMVKYFDFGYLSNFHCLFHGAPSFVEHLFRPSKWKQGNDYTSEFGQTKGWGAPSECGDYWYRFFRRRPQFVPLKDVNKKTIFRLRGVIRLLGNGFKRPILFKNMNCALRLEPIIKALPEAVFLVTHRNELDNAQSLLKVRKNIHGTYDQWWSMEPPSVEELKKLPCYQQVVLQIRHIHLLIDEARRTCPNKFFEINFKDFCLDTHHTLEAIRNFLISNGISVKKKGDVRSSFHVESIIEIDKELYMKLKEYLNDNT